MHVDAKITSKNQITLPRAVRERLGVGAGGRVRFQIEEDGTVRVQPRGGSLEDLRGIIKVPDHLRGLSWEEIRQMTHDAIAESRLGHRD